MTLILLCSIYYIAPNTCIIIDAGNVINISFLRERMPAKKLEETETNTSISIFN